MKKIAVVFALFVVLAGCGESKPAVEIETFNKVNPLFNVKYVQVKIKSIVDEVVIKDVTVNRGNCKIENRNVLSGKPIFPAKLKFGESVSVSFTAPCEATEVSVDTSDGGWTVSY